MPDPFDRFVEECGLRLTAECLSVAPRDVLTPLPQVEQHFLVTLSRPEVKADPVRLIFVTPLATRESPRIRDVLWWVAGDAWVVEQGQRDLGTWAASFGYPADAEPAARLFEQHCRQADVLASLLGDFNYRHLLSLYDSEISPMHAGQDHALR